MHACMCSYVRKMHLCSMFDGGRSGQVRPAHRGFGWWALYHTPCRKKRMAHAQGRYQMFLNCTLPFHVVRLAKCACTDARKGGRVYEEGAPPVRDVM